MEKLQAAVALHKQGRLDEAATIYREVLEVDENNFHALRLYGCVLRIFGRLREGIPLLERAVSISPSDADCLCSLANSYSDDYQHEIAIEYYEKCLLLRNEYPEALIGMGWSLSEIGRLDESCSFLQRAVSLNPFLFQGWLNLGNNFTKQMMFQEAIRSYWKAIELNPGFAEAYLNLGNVFHVQGQLEEACACHLKSVKLDKTLKEGFFYLFQSYFSRAVVDVSSKDILSTLSRRNCDSISVDRYICFGDSHVSVFDGLESFETVRVIAATAYNLTKPHSSTRAREKILSRLSSASVEHDAILLSFGEVDIRANILEYCIKLGLSIDEVCAEVVLRYCTFIEEIRSKGFEIIIFGPFGSGNCNNSQGNIGERYYASCTLESFLRQEAEKMQIPYFSLHGVLNDPVSRKTCLDFFEDNLHFHGYSIGKISSNVKCMVLSRMLEAINAVKVARRPMRGAILAEASLISLETLCLLDVFSSEDPVFSQIGLNYDATERVKILSQANQSVVLDLSSCLNVNSCHLSLSCEAAETSFDDWEIWGLDDNGKIATSVFNYSQVPLTVARRIDISAHFPERSMLRYLVLTFPEGALSPLIAFDVRGKSFVFS